MHVPRREEAFAGKAVGDMLPECSEGQLWALWSMCVPLQGLEMLDSPGGVRKGHRAALLVEPRRGQMVWTTGRQLCLVLVS